MMGVLTFFLYMLEALVCLLLMGAILIQRTKSQGMGLALGAGMGEAMFGSQAGNVMTRATVILAAIFLANTTLLAIIGTQRVERSAADSAVSAPVAPPAPVSAPAPGPANNSDVFAPLASTPAGDASQASPAPAAGGVPPAPMQVTIPAAGGTPAAETVPAAAVPVAAPEAAPVEPVSAPGK